MKLPKKSARRLVYVVVTVCLVLLLIGGGYWVYAALTATDRKENDFQVGQVETKIFEEKFDEDMTEVTKGETVPKEVRIENTGTIKQFVRVMVLPEVQSTVTGETIKQVLPLKIGTDVELAEMSTAGWNADWIDGGDGYYYYQHALDPKARTGYLFKTVKLKSQLEDRYHDASLTISLKVETINCAEFAYRDAWWQGATPSDQPLKAVDDALKTKVEN